MSTGLQKMRLCGFELEREMARRRGAATKTEKAEFTAEA
jgi:hypothetical protein